MGYVHATIALSNSRRPELDALPLSARTESGARCFASRLPWRAALQVLQESLREVSVADGRVLQVPYVGLLQVDFEGRCCFVGALVLGDEVVPGAVPMEAMDLIVNPARQPLEVEPQKRRSVWTAGV